jgi:hypothetical protein
VKDTVCAAYLNRQIARDLATESFAQTAGQFHPHT